jgi:prepilin-type N-terminal cleavage/methylation domain-containing protein
MNNKKGFTMVELLVVLVIVAILAAVATPIYLANVQRSRASEAVSSMALIRQAQRDFRINANAYFDIATDDVDLPLPTVAIAADGTYLGTAGVAVNAGVARFFSNEAFSVDAGTGIAANGTSGLFLSPNAVDFIISATGNIGDNCAAGATTDCTTNGTEVTNYRLEMDNSGRTFVSYDSGTTWAAY